MRKLLVTSTSETSARRIAAMSNDVPANLREVAQRASLRHGGAKGRGIAREAERIGVTMTHTTFDNLLTGRYKSRPGRETLEALAALSGCTLEQVYTAAGEPLPMSPLRDDLPPDADLLTGTQRRVVIDTIRLFAQQNKALAALRDELDEGGGAHAGGAAPNTPPGSGPVPTHPTALRLLKSADWDVSKALELIDAEDDTAETAIAADEIRSLVPLTPAQLEAARRSAERPPRGQEEQPPD